MICKIHFPVKWHYTGLEHSDYRMANQSVQNQPVATVILRGKFSSWDRARSILSDHAVCPDPDLFNILSDGSSSSRSFDFDFKIVSKDGRDSVQKSFKNNFRFFIRPQSHRNCCYSRSSGISSTSTSALWCPLRQEHGGLKRGLSSAFVELEIILD